MMFNGKQVAILTDWSSHQPRRSWSLPSAANRARWGSTRRLDSWFFTKGQVIETHRGKGIYQNAIDEATRKLEQGQWVSRLTRHHHIATTLRTTC